MEIDPLYFWSDEFFDELYRFGVYTPQQMEELEKIREQKLKEKVKDASDGNLFD